MDPKYLTIPQLNLSLLSRLDWFDNSSIETFQDCNRLGWYKYMHGLSGQSAAMAAGTVLHKAIEIWNLTQDHDKAAIELLREYGKNQTILTQGANKYSTGNLTRVFEDYCNKYQGDFLQYHAQEVKIAWRMTGSCGATVMCQCSPSDPNRCFFLVGRCDGIVTYLGNIYALENKTTSSLNENYLKGLQMSRQASTYTFALSNTLYWNGHPAPLKGILFNVVAFGATKTEFSRFPVFRNAGQLNDFEDELWRLVIQIRSSYQLSTTKPIQNTHQCNRYGHCQFIPLCEAWSGHSIENPPEIFRTFKREQWKPF